MNNQSVWETPANEDQNKEYGIMLPCAPEDFREFISGLLGKPQIITKEIGGTFDIDKAEVENFYHLLLQRITQQNGNTLIQFTATIVYDDESTVMLTGIESFSSYIEVRPAVSKAINLSWIFLVKFQDRKVPEKQIVDLSINTEGYIGDLSRTFFPLVSFSLSGSFDIRISHTARTWGIDIESLLTGQIENLLKKKNRLKEFINRHSFKVGISSGILTFLTALIICIYAVNTFLNARIEGLKSFASPSDRLEYMINLTTAAVWQRFFLYNFFFLIGAFILSIFVAFWSGSAAKIKEPSFLLLSKKAVEQKAERVKKNDRQWFWFVVSIVVSLLVNIISSIIFALYIQSWAEQLR